MLGFMLNTMFLSMWISNTACTAMMVPILQAVLTELKEVHFFPVMLNNFANRMIELLLIIAIQISE